MRVGLWDDQVVVNPSATDLRTRSRLNLLVAGTEEAIVMVECAAQEVSEAEIVQAIHAPIPATSLDAVKRRLRPGAGRCQGGFCGPRVIAILARELGIDVPDVVKDGPGSEIVVQRNKEVWR